MGFDLTAKNKRLGDKGYLRASIYQMIFLRASMVAAGIDERLVYGKFVGNDGLLVTALQSKKIADRLTTWLRGRNLTVSLSEDNGLANASNEAYFEAIQELGGPEDKRTVKQFSKAKSQRFKLDAKARKVVWEFAEFSPIVRADSGCHDPAAASGMRSGDKKTLRGFLSPGKLRRKPGRSPSLAVSHLAG